MNPNPRRPGGPSIPRRVAGTVAAVAGLLAPAAWGACAPDALGTARTLTLARTGAAYGTAQHAALPLAPHEVVITFDDGPSAQTTPEVLRVLREHCVRATFFMLGEALAREPALARQVRAEGHSVGLHSYRHDHLGTLEEPAQLADLQATQEAYRQVFGVEAPAWRFPFLEETPPLLAALRERGLTVLSVDAGIDDWLPDQSPQVLTDRLLERLRQPGGGIVLLHDIQPQTARALPRLLAALRANGYRVVHLEWAAQP